MKDEVKAKLVAASGSSVRAKAIYVIACLVDLLWGILCLIGWPQSTRRAPSLIFFSLGVSCPSAPGGRALPFMQRRPAAPFPACASRP